MRHGRDYDGHGGTGGHGDQGAGAPNVGGSLAHGTGGSGNAGNSAGEDGNSAGEDARVSGDAGCDACGTKDTAGCAGDAAGGSDGDVTPAITAVAWIQPDSCEYDVPYEVRDVRDQDGAPVTDYTCEWTFSDGAVVETCAGARTFTVLPREHGETVVVRAHPLSKHLGATWIGQLIDAVEEVSSQPECMALILGDGSKGTH